MAKIFAHDLKASIHLGRHSRLLLDLNRAIDAKTFWSPWSNEMPDKLKRRAISQYYLPYRSLARVELRRLLKEGPVTLLAVHSFTPIYKGKKRKTDIGLLFRPHHLRERQLAQAVRRELSAKLPGWKIHFNRPYRGYTDCFLNDLSDELGDRDDAVGLFLEFNQARIRTRKQRGKLGAIMTRAMAAAAQVIHD